MEKKIYGVSLSHEVFYITAAYQDHLQIILYHAIRHVSSDLWLVFYHLKHLSDHLVHASSLKVHETRTKTRYTDRLDPLP